MSHAIVKVNDKPNSALYTEYVIDSTSDVSSLPTNVADGSIAYTANLAHIYILKSGTWVEVG